MNSITPLVEQIFLYQVRKNIKCGAQNLDVRAIRLFICTVYKPSASKDSKDSVVSKTLV